MEKYHNYIAVAINVSFLILLQEFSYPRPVFRFLIPIFFLFAAIISLYHYWYLRKIEKFNLWTLIRPVLYYASAFSLFIIITPDFLKGLFLISAVALGFVFEIFMGKFAENVVLNETLLVAFGMFMSVFAYALYYAPAFLTWYLAIIFVGSFLSIRSLYEFIPNINGSRLTASVAIALFMTQIFWTLTFLPLHYSADAIILFNAFYFCVILNYYYAFNNLNTRKFQLHFFIFMGINIFILVVTPWKILLS